MTQEKTLVQTSAQRALSNILAFRKKKDDGDATENELRILLGELEGYFVDSQQASAQDLNFIAIDIRELCSKMEHSLGINQINGSVDENLFNRLSGIATEIEAVAGTTEELCEELGITLRDDDSVKERLEAALNRTDEATQHTVDVMDGVIDVLDRRILSGDDQKLRPRIEALRESIKQYPLDPESIHFSEFATSRVICA